MNNHTITQPELSHTEAQETFTKREFPNKRLIVCCDGTWNADDVTGQPLTNVAKIARCIDAHDTYKGNNFVQIVHYQPGVGTGTGKFSNIRDAVIGRGECFKEAGIDEVTDYCRNFSVYSCSLQIHFSQLVFAKG